MLSRIFENVFRPTNSDFEAYCMFVQRGALAGMPTADEAKKDYKAAIWSRDIMRLL